MLLAEARRPLPVGCGGDSFCGELLQVICSLKKMSGTVTLFYSSVSSNLEIKKQQQKIEMILSSKKIPFEKVDVAASSDEKDRMRRIAGDPQALPPQLANGEQYCGNYDAFEEAVEQETLESFLKI